MGLNYDAKPDDIKKAYRRACIKYHPDVNKDGEKLFMEIKEAYEVLIDEQERKRYDFIRGYDMLRQTKQKTSAKSENKKSKQKSEKKYNYDFDKEYKKSSFTVDNDIKPETKSSDINSKNKKFSLKLFTFSDILNLFLKPKNKKQSNKKENVTPIDGEDITMTVEISYQEALNGTNRKINVLHTEVCPVCGGKTFSNGTHCKCCNGTGEISIHKKLNVKIPPHTENNKKIRLKNEGTKGLKGGKNGHLYLIVKITDDSFFKFDGNNVLCEVAISPVDAVLGCIKEVRTINGMAKLKIPPKTSSGQKFRLAHEGLFDEITKTKGDQIVTIKIKIDDNLTERERQLYEELRNISHK